MITVKPSALAIISLILAVLGVLIIALSVATGRTDDPLFELFPTKLTSGSFGIFLAILRVSSYAVVIAGPALCIGIGAFRATRGTDRTSNRIAFGAIILSCVVMLATLVSFEAYISTSKRIADNIDTRSNSERVRDFLNNDIDVVFGTFEPSTDDSGKQLAEFTVTVTNKKSQAQDYSIIFDAIDETGGRIAQNSVYTVGLGARQTKGYKSTFYNLDTSQIEAMRTATFRITHIAKQ